MNKRWYLKCLQCGGKAFFLQRKPKEGDVIHAKDVIHKDKPQFGELIRCQECKEVLISNIEIKYVFKNI